VRELCEVAFSHVGLDWKKYVIQDKRFFRPAEVQLLQGDPSRARRELGWKLRVDFRGLVEMMVDADVEKVRQMIAMGIIKNKSQKSEGRRQK
jgi:GDPmannose 4,6-dehydratase